jgi:hypothetical protein
MMYVVRRVLQLIQHVVARRHQTHRDEPDRELPRERPGVDVRDDRHRDDHARQHEDVLEPVIDAADAEMRPEPLGRGSVTRPGGDCACLGAPLRLRLHVHMVAPRQLRSRS